MAEDTKVEDVEDVVDVEPEPEPEDVAEGVEPEPEPEKEAAQEESDASFASIFDELAAKGEAVMAALSDKAEEAAPGINEKADKASARIDAFAQAMQTRAERAAEQFGSALDAFAQALQKSKSDAEKDASEEAADEPAYEPRFTPNAQAYREKMGVGMDSELLLTDPEFVERFANFAFDDVIGDVDLPDRTRFMCWLATLLGCQGIDEYCMLLPAALNMGVEPEAVKEIVYQASAYLGIGRVYPFLLATNDAFLMSGIELPLESQAGTEPSEESRYEGGEKAQCAAFGEQMQGFKDKGNPDYPHINQWLVKHCFGDWYTRGSLTMAEREMITFCFLAAQGGCENQLRSHTAGNLNCGNDREFLIKVVSNNVPFIGYPRSLNAMAIVDEVTAAD